MKSTINICINLYENITIKKLLLNLNEDKK